ncbi:DUF721 domain-containing protein [uncultured Planktosalinus sp.]|uniref:DUF721 domain-containing protein n=1 Tax=uncultured Planktosalinus sp. TaxID=1810935 RepID=UPI0030D82BCA
MKKRHGQEVSISEVLKEFVNNNKLDKGLEQIQAAEAWNKLMGPAIKKYTTAVKLNRGKLFVQLNSSVLREELSYGKQKIIKLMNEELGDELIKEIILQ